MLMMSVRPGLFGPVLQKQRLLMPIGFSGVPAPNRGLVLGRGRACFRVVRLGGRKVRKARGNAGDAHDAAGVFLIP